MTWNCHHDGQHRPIVLMYFHVLFCICIANIVLHNYITLQCTLHKVCPVLVAGAKGDGRILRGRAYNYSFKLDKYTMNSLGNPENMHRTPRGHETPAIRLHDKSKTITSERNAGGGLRHCL